MILLAVQAILSFQSHKIQTHRPGSDSASVRKFVQSYYDWYIPVAANEKIDGQILAVVGSVDAFTPGLHHALQEDMVADRHSELLVGLDFDPFLNSQDPPSHYLAGKVAKKGKSWLVQVQIPSIQGSPAATMVTAQVEKMDYGWRFQNFLYPNGGNLLGILRDLKRERKSSPANHVLWEHARYSSARSIRMGLDAGGADKDPYDHPLAAKDYGPALLSEGFVMVSPANYVAKFGDVVVISGSPTHPLGHVETYTGKAWVSDYKQASLMPYQQPVPFKIYRIPVGKG
jgi:hypothetical protein